MFQQASDSFSTQQLAIKETKSMLYKRRWAILTAQFLLQAMCGIAFSCFGEINNFYVAYFDVSYWEVDWLTLAHNAPVIAVTVPLAILTFYNIIRLRCLTLISACGVTLGFACFVTSFSNKSLFPLMVVGQLAIGISAQIMQAIPPIFASLWFPENEVGTAIASQVMGMSFGCAMGALLPVTVIRTDSGVESERKGLFILYIALLALAVLVNVFLCIYMTDVPPLPPTEAQAARKINQDSQSPAPRKLTDFLQATKSLFKNKTFVLASLIYGIELQVNTIMFLMVSQIVRPIADALPSGLTVDQSGAYLIVASTGGGALFSLVAGAFVNRYKKYKLIAIFGSLIYLAFSLGFLLSWLFPVYPALCVMNFLSVGAQKFALVTLYDVVMQTTFPMDESFVGVWMSGIQTPLGILYGIAGRAVFNQWGALGVLVFMRLNILVGFALCFALSSNNKRIEFQNALPDNNNITEETRLIQQ